MRKYMKNQNKGSLYQQFEGFYKVSVIDWKTNGVIWEQPEWNKNLILNQGMDGRGTVFHAVFDQPQSKTNTQMLTLVFKWILGKSASINDTIAYSSI